MDLLKQTLFYGDIGSLVLADVRFDPNDKAYCNPLPNGRLQLRLHTEADFTEANVVVTDGDVYGVPMALVGESGRFRYWEAVIQPARPRIRYSFAFKRAKFVDNPAVYWAFGGQTHAAESPFTLDLAVADPFTTPDWVKGSVIYQIFPERFANGRPETTPANAVAWGTVPQVYQFQGGDLHGVAQKIDYLHNLGIDIIYLNPINTSFTNHKYDAVDFYHVDPAFGGDAALRELVAAAHGRGIKIILDASFNHCYPRFFAFEDMIKNGPDSHYADWFTVHDWPVRVISRPHLIERHPERDRFLNWFKHFEETAGVPIVRADDDGPLTEPTYEAWFNVLGMPKLNHSNPEVRQYFLDVAAYWLREFDIDGWRMDVAQHVVDEFWVAFRRVCRETKADCYLLAEIWGNTNRWLQGDMFDATMNYLFRDLALGFFAGGRMPPSQLADGLLRLEANYPPQVAAVNHNLISSHDVARFRHLADEDDKRFRLATFFQLTMPGAAGIYYGDEIGMTGGHDPDNRRAFPWDDESVWDRELLVFVQRLVQLRRGNPALKLGRWRPLHHDDAADAFAFLREHEEQRVAVLLNRRDHLDEIMLPVAAPAAKLLYGTAELQPAEGELAVRNVPEWSGVVIEL